MSVDCRQTYSSSDLKCDDRVTLTGELWHSGSFKNFMRMSSAGFEHFINLVGHKISKRDTNYRDYIPVKEQLAIML
jgi:hypothetical protein